MELEIWTFFLVLSSMTNVKQKLVSAEKVFWQVLCMLYDHFFGIRETEPNLFQIKAILPKKKHFRRLFLIMPSTADDENLFVGLGKVFWQIRC